MTHWHAVVPIKPVATRKTRLRGHLTPTEIETLTEVMLRHVLDVAGRVEAIGTVTLLAAERYSGWTGDWFPDPGMGLNAALGAMARAVPDRLLVLHADLPALVPDDVAAMVAADGASVSPDLRGAGTNAIALGDARDFDFAFGAGSFERHCAALPGAGIVRRPGLALDIDLPEDLAQAIRLGHLPATL